MTTLPMGPSSTSIEGPRLSWPRRHFPVIATATIGLLVGIGVTFVALRSGDDRPSVFGGPASVKTFDQPAGTTGSAPITGDDILRRARDQAAVGPAAPAVEPATPRDAIQQFLAAEVADEAETSFALLDVESQRRYGNATAWRASRADRVIAASFSVVSDRRLPDGAAEVTVRATRSPSITLFRGLVPAVATETWSVRRLDGGGGWRVADGRERSSDPELPPDSVAIVAAQRWIDAAVQCDQNIVALQLAPVLLGSPELADLACRTKGTWHAAPRTTAANDVSDITAFVAAYGPGVGRWGRGVVVASADGAQRIAVVLGPVGQDWRVMGLTAAPPA